ncbi:ASST-domain-containing protein, partial [Delphinella strobiligena]
DFGSYPYKSFRSVDLISPAIRKAVDSPQCYDENHIFLSPRGYRIKNPGLAILDNQGELVWEHYVQGQPYNFAVQEYQGDKVLTFWVGNDLVEGHGEGDFYIYNSAYEEIAKISSVVGGMRPDLHEFTITPEGTALLTIYQSYVVRQPGIFRLKDTVFIWDCLVLEVDLATREPLFQWRASDHHDLNETYHPIGGTGFSPEHPWDWYHINSVQKDELGNYLVSARYTSTITYINGTSGDIIWILGGKRNSFQDLSDGQATNTAYQHLARLHSLTDFPLLTTFDNGADGEKSDRPARGALIELTYPTRIGTQGSSLIPLTARLVQSYSHPNHIIALSQGSMQLVPTSNGSDPKVLLGFGYIGVWTEFSADEKVLCDNRFSTTRSWGQGHVQSYQVLKAPWIGKPSSPPSVARGSTSGSRPSVFVSWNGATEVRSWKLQTSEEQANMDDEKWTDIAMSERTGFETKIEYPAGNANFLRVVALDKNGNVLGKS